ncbi:MAG: hypothetical protein LBP76_09470 [Treponema sp.]|jgi:hypothetical protein|nr:hypothetical protein [Treponema sp.]
MKKRNRFKNADPIKPEAIPILSPNYEALGNVYEVVQAIHYPAEGSGGYPYYYGYWNSLVEKLKDRPFPGSKDLFRGGHENESADFYTVGIKLDGNEEEGTAYLRIAVPDIDMNGNTNEGFVRALKMGGVEFSIVADVEPETINGKTGFHRELGRPRNDLAGEGAMEQSVFANKAGKEKDLIDLARAGKIVENKDSGELILNGMVNIAAIKNIRPHDEPIRVKILALADNYKKNHNSKEKNMEIDEKTLNETVAKAVSDALAAAEKAREEANKKARNELSAEHQADLRRVAQEAELGLSEDASISDVVEAILEAVKSAAEATAESEANKFAGRKFMKNANDKDVIDPVYEVALETFKAGGNKVLNKVWRDEQSKALNNKASVRALRERNANPYDPANGGEPPVVY